MNKVSERLNRNKPVEEEIVTDEVATLREIRDLLAQRRADGSL